ncbi:MAG: hypothetical protein ACTSRG_17800 [Candidatus Helarchaeota archaeon]
MLKFNYKYIIILAFIAGILYFIVSIFTLGTVESIEGNFAGYILLIVSWIFIIIFARIFQDRLKIKELLRFLILGMIIHVYFCFFYYLSKIDNLYSLITLPILFIALYGLYNKDGLLNLFSIFRYYLPLGNLGHPFAYDKEYNAYIFKNFRSYEVLKYLEIKEGKDPIKLLTIFFKSQIELSLEIHNINNKLRYFCGILTKDSCHLRALETCKRKFYELFNYLRYFGYDPVEVWDDYTLEEVLEGPYLSWDPIEYTIIKNNDIPEDEKIIVQTGLKRKKISCFQLYSNNSLLKNQPKTRFSIKRLGGRQIKTEITETNEGESGLNTFIQRITEKNNTNSDFLFILRLHPFNENELNKERSRIKNDLTRVMDKFKLEFANNEANYRMLQFNNVLENYSSNSRRSQILTLLYPDESKELEKNWEEFNCYELGREIGYWKFSTYFVGKKILANMLATDCKATLRPLNIAYFQNIIRRKIFGVIENLDSKGVVNFLPFDPNIVEVDEKENN